MIEGELGAGGMGVVYRALDTRLGRVVAIKVLPPALATDPDRLARFEREARLLACLNHPHIGAIYGVEEAGDVRGLVLELVEGESLDHRLHAGPLPFATAVTLARQITEALDAAHEKGIVHRDLKPANIKITPDGIVKVLDFGLAKALNTDASDSGSATLTSAKVAATFEGGIVGTAPYMSPEQARGRPVDKRTDIWAFGCVLYEMLAGRRAFGGETVSDTIVAILEREPDWAALPGDVPVELRRLLHRCLEKDSRRRIRDIGDARLELESIGSPPPGSDLASSVLGPAGMAGSAFRESALPRARLPWAVAALAVLVAAGALLWSTRLNPRVGLTAAGAPRLMRAVRLTHTAAQEFGPAVSPDGKWVAYYASFGGRSDLWVKFLDNGATLNLTGSLNLELPARTAIGGLAISPDGNQIAFAARSGDTPQYDTWVIPGPVGGMPRKLLEYVPGIQWSPDGTQLTYIIPGSSRGDTLAVAESDGTHQRVLIEHQGGRHIHWPAWSRDGKFIYFIYTYDTWHTEPSEIYRVATSGGALEPAVRAFRRAVYPVPMPGGDLMFAGNPETLDLGLCWQPQSGGAPQTLTAGVGEYTEPQLSADGRRLVATLVEVRRSLISVAVTGTGPQVHSLTDGYGGDLDPCVDPRGDRVVFSSSRSGRRNLWLARSDGSRPAPLTTEAAIDERPAFSPDGQQIAFVSDRGGHRGIWLINAAGGAPRQLAREVVLDTLTWSRDGRRILFARPGTDLPVLATVRVADGVVEPFPTPSGAFAPEWSPADDVLAYLEPVALPASAQSTVTRSRIFLRFADGQGHPLFPNLPPPPATGLGFANGFLAWSPDGRRVAVASVPSGTAQLWVVDPRAAQPYQKVADLPAASRPRGITWTRDGSRLIIGNQESSSDIVLFDVVK